VPTAAATEPYAIPLHQSIIKFEFCPALSALNDHFLSSFVTTYTKLLSKIKI
jgi:hypothetical protein